MLSRWLSAWRTWRAGLRADRDLDDELRATVDLIAEEKIARGVPANEARRAAFIELGGLESVKEQVRSARAGAAIEGVVRDVRYALRMLRRHPGFTAAAVLTLALGVGANTAIFSVVDAVLLKSLPVAAPSQLVLIDLVTARNEEQNVSYPLFERLRDDPDLTGPGRGVLSSLVAVLDGTLRVGVVRSGAPGPELRATLQLVDGEYFPMLGVHAPLGRTLTRADDGPAADPHVVVLSHRFWKARLASDPAIVGSTILVKGRPLEIVGVAEPRFFGESVGRAPDMWAPLALQPELDRRSYLDAANVGWLRLIGRMRGDLAGRGAYDRINVALAIARDRIQKESTPAGRYSSGITLRASDGRRGLEAFRERFARPLGILTAIVAIVLLIACANVANLFLARAMGRQREIGIRLAIGAGRPRIIRQLITESVVLAVIGASIGLLIGAWGSHILLVLASAEAGARATGPVPIALTFDARVLAFTAGLSLLTVVIVGLAPALMASNVDVSTSFRKADRSGPRTPMARVLVIAQVALSMALVTSAGLFLQTLQNLRTRDVGFTPDALLELDVRSTSPQSPEALVELTRRLRERLQSVPGIAAVSFAHAGFGGGMSRTCCIAIEGYAHQPGEQRQIRMLGIGPDYFRTMGLRVTEGRDFAAHEAVVDPNRLTVAIVNEAFARRYLSGRSAVGARFGWGDPPRVRYRLEIVGVVRDAVYDSLRETTAPLVYFPSASGETYVLRAAESPDGIVPLVRHEVTAVESSLQFDVRTVASMLDAAVARERLLSRLSGFFGIVGMLLAAIGVYGLLAYGVARRTKEIGIRMALGADRRALLAGELRAAFALAAIGLAGGIPLTIAGGALVRSQLFGIASTDPATIGWAAALLATVAGAAALLPALRASRVDPIAALRCD